MKFTAKNLHDTALHLSENLVDESLATGAKWQKIMTKALKEGTVLIEKQQDLTFTTLEELKNQVISGNKRFRKLLGFDLPNAKTNSKVKKTEKTVAKKSSRSTTSTARKTTRKPNLKK